jgi:OOP family OmpA-OmpF porin
MQKAVWFLAILLVGWIGGGTWYWVCKVRHLCPEEGISQTYSSPPSLPKPEIEGSNSRRANSILPPFQVAYQGKVVLNHPTHLRFGKSSEVPWIPGSLTGTLDELVAYLKANPNQDLEIVGSYAEEETNASGQLNLGLARANAFRAELMKRGLEANRFIQLPRQVKLSEAFGTTDTMIGGIGLKFLERSLAEVEPEEEEAEEGTGAADRAVVAEEEAISPPPTFEPRELRFAFGSAELVLTETDRTYISRCIQYLKQHPDQALSLTGHTDDAGVKADNQVLGLGRANTIKEYFVAFGFLPTAFRPVPKENLLPLLRMTPRPAAKKIAGLSYKSNNSFPSLPFTTLNVIFLCFLKDFFQLRERPSF